MSRALGFLKYARRLMADYEETIQAMEGSQEKTLRIGTINLLKDPCMPPVLKTLRDLDSAVSVRLTTGTPASLYGMLADHQLDMVFLIDDKQKHAGFSTRCIKEEELALIVPEKHRFTREFDGTFEEIRDEDFVLTDEGWGLGFLPLFAMQQEEGIAKIPFRGGEAPLFSQIVYRQSDLCTHGLIKKLAAAITQATA